jgi:hypothetical protein
LIQRTSQEKRPYEVVFYFNIVTNTEHKVGLKVTQVLEILSRSEIFISIGIKSGQSLKSPFSFNGLWKNPFRLLEQWGSFIR